MTTDLERLLLVQDRDSAVDQLRHRRATHPARARLAAAEQAVAAVQSTLDGVTAERHDVGRRQKRLEDEIAALETKQASVNKKLAIGTIPKELQALAADLDAIKRQQSTVEDELLDVMEQAELLDARIDALTGERTAHDGDAASARVELAEAEVAIDAELVTVAAERAEAAGSVPPALLARYESMRPKMEGVAIARLVGGRCTGCNLTLPSVEVDRIRHEPPDAIVECEQCGRLLVR